MENLLFSIYNSKTNKQTKKRLKDVRMYVPVCHLNDLTKVSLSLWLNQG